MGLGFCIGNCGWSFCVIGGVVSVGPLVAKVAKFTKVNRVGVAVFCSVSGLRLVILPCIVPATLREILFARAFPFLRGPA